jgi:hypothetical protein
MRTAPLPAIALALLLVLSALLAGCTSPTASTIQPGETTPAPTETLPAATTPVTVAVTPAAVQTLPAEQFVDLTLQKQRPDSSIRLLYNGGKGEMFVQNIFMKVSLSNGEVKEAYMNDNTRRPRRGDELVIGGSRGSDHVEVFVTSAGTTYKVKDENLILSYL